jgi:hypothetical protein
MLHTGAAATTAGGGDADAARGGIEFALPEPLPLLTPQNANSYEILSLHEQKVKRSGAVQLLDALQ